MVKEIFLASIVCVFFNNLCYFIFYVKRFMGFVFVFSGFMLFIVDALKESFFFILAGNVWAAHKVRQAG